MPGTAGLEVIQAVEKGSRDLGVSLHLCPGAAHAREKTKKVLSSLDPTNSEFVLSEDTSDAFHT